jgi:hypothetical protein
MRLTSVRPGDIVRAAGMHALVLDKQRGVLVVRGLCNHSTRRLRADEIEAHWRLARGGARVPPAPRPIPAPGTVPTPPSSIFIQEGRP